MESKSWIISNLHIDRESCCPTSEVYGDYKDWMRRYGRIPLAKYRFKSLVIETFPQVHNRRLGARDSITECFVGLRYQKAPPAEGPSYCILLEGVRWGGKRAGWGGGRKRQMEWR